MKSLLWLCTKKTTCNPPGYRRVPPMLLVFTMLVVVACTGGGEQSATGSSRHAPAGPYTAGLIGPDGGVIKLPAVVSVGFPAGSLGKQQTVSVMVIREPSARALFLESTELYGVTVGLPYQIQINTGFQQPRQPVNMEITMPDDFRGQLAPDSWVRLFGYIRLDEGDLQMELYEHCGGRFRPADGAVVVPLIPEYFSNSGTKDGSYQALVSLGASPAK